MVRVGSVVVEGRTQHCRGRAYPGSSARFLHLPTLEVLLRDLVLCDELMDALREVARPDGRLWCYSRTLTHIGEAETTLLDAKA